MSLFVCLSVCLSVCLPVFSLVCLPTCLTLYLSPSLCLSVCLFVFWSFYLLAGVIACLLVCLCVSLSDRPAVCRSNRRQPPVGSLRPCWCSQRRTLRPGQLAAAVPGSLPPTNLPCSRPLVLKLDRRGKAEVRLPETHEELHTPARGAPERDPNRAATTAFASAMHERSIPPLARPTETDGCGAQAPATRSR